MPWIRWRAAKSGRQLASLQWRDEDGKVCSRALKTSDPRIAEMHLRIAKREHGGAPDASRSTQPRALLEDFLAERRLQVKPATVSIEEDRLGSLFKAWKRVPMATWTRGRLVEYVSTKDWSPRTTQIFLRCCKRFIRWAHERDAPVPDFVGTFRGPKVRSEAFEPLTPKAVRQLLQLARGTYLELPIALGVYAGLSLGDICELTWDQVDLKRGVIERPRAKTGAPICMPIAPTLDTILRRSVAMRGPVCRGLPTKESMGRALRRLYKRIGVEGGRGTWHRLRHSCGTMLYRASADITTVGLGLAHRPGSPISLRYVHPDAERLRAAVEAMDRRIESESA